MLLPHPLEHSFEGERFGSVSEALVANIDRPVSSSRFRRSSFVCLSWRLSVTLRSTLAFGKGAAQPTKWKWFCAAPPHCQLSAARANQTLVNTARHCRVTFLASPSALAPWFWIPGLTGHQGAAPSHDGRGILGSRKGSCLPIYPPWRARGQKQWQPTERPAPNYPLGVEQLVRGARSWTSGAGTCTWGSCRSSLADWALMGYMALTPDGPHRMILMTLDIVTILASVFVVGPVGTRSLSASWRVYFLLRLVGRNGGGHRRRASDLTAGREALWPGCWFFPSSSVVSSTHCAKSSAWRWWRSRVLA